MPRRATSCLNGRHFSVHHRPVRFCHFKFQFIFLFCTAPKAPLCKGGCQKSPISDWGIVQWMLRFRRKPMRIRCCLPQQSLRQPVRLTVACGQPGRGSGCPPDSHSLPRLRFAYPLHKGGFWCGGGGSGFCAALQRPLIRHGIRRATFPSRGRQEALPRQWETLGAAENREKAKGFRTWAKPIPQFVIYNL